MGPREELQAILDDYVAGRTGLRVLEAGCGSASHVRFGEGQVVVGIDISERQLERNELLSEKIVGDLQDYPLTAESFDIIVCWDVLEHLPRPECALRNMSRALRPGGGLVLALPDVESLKGRITKFTPYWFHVWTYRRVLGVMDAGKDGRGPFPTFLRSSLSVSGLRAFARSCNLRVSHMRRYESSMQAEVLRRSRVIGLGWRFAGPGIRRLSRGRVDERVSDILAVLMK